MGFESQEQNRCFGLAVAAQLRAKYEFHAAKQIARDLDCGVKAAENLLEGHLSARSITKLVKAYGLGLLIDAGGTLTGQSLHDYVAEQAEQARRIQDRAREREREFLELEKKLDAGLAHRRDVGGQAL